jgi:nitrogen fixation protein NifX
VEINMTAVRKLRIIDTEGQEPMAAAEPAVRVALATQDLKNLDAHFGSARNFVIYDVTRSGWARVGAITFDAVSDEQGAHATDGEDRISPKVEALKGCHLLFCLAIGGPAAAKAVASRIHPIKARPATIEDVLEKVRAMLTGSPPPWLRKVLDAAGVGTPKPDFEED